MVKLNKGNLRHAIAMIELIFALVIMGIAMMSAPMLMSTATNSTFVGIQQEGINEASTRINMIMGYQWDENDTDDKYIPPILNVKAGASDLNQILLTSKRIGIPKESYRSFILSDKNSSQLYASALGSDGGDSDDIDDFGNVSLSQVQASTSDYVEKNILISTAVAYNLDSVSGGYSQTTIQFSPFATSTDTTNIKSITVTLTSSSGVSELDKTIILRGFSCNIGGYQLEERSF